MLRAKNRHAKAPSLDISVFDEIIASGDPATRLKLARQLAGLVAARSTPPAERQEVTPSLLKLLMDPVHEIRAAIADILCPVAQLHPDIIFAIAADEEDIALPFLALSPSVRGRRQLAIFEAGDLARRKALAGRCDIDEKTLSVMALKGEAPIVRVLLDNPSAQLHADDLKRIYVRFRDDPSITERLLSRPDLPLEIRIAHVRATTKRLREKLARRKWLPANDMQTLLASSEEDALVEILARAGNSSELMAALKFMSHKDALTPSVILRAGCHGHVMVLEHALAYLAGLPLRRANGLLNSKNGLSLRALYSKSGLPQSCFLLVRAIFETGRDLGLESFGDAAPAPAEFGRALLEKLVSGYDRVAVSEKARQVDILSRFCDEETRLLARHFRSGLLQAA